MNVFVFDIETVPDTDNGERLLGLSGLNPAEVASAMTTLQRQKSASHFLPHYLQRVVAISLVLANHERVKVWSLGDKDAHEKEIIERFFSGIDKYSPTLVSWNGGGFDLPVLHYRALLHGVVANRYWEIGNDLSEFRYNNYLNRYHYRHMDLMDILAAYHPRANAPLDDIALMLGFPGKMGMHGSQVWDYFQRGEIAPIRHYCEADALNTYLIYLRFELVRGQLTWEAYQQQCQRLRHTLQEANQPHLTAFLKAWHE